MLKKSVASVGLIFFVLYLLSALKAAADVVTDPVRLYGFGEVRTIAVSADRKFMATGGQGGVFLWDFETGEFVERLETEGWATVLMFSPDSKVLVGATGPRIVSWNAETGARLREFEGHSGEIYSMKFAPGGKTFISTGADNRARVWSLETGEIVHEVSTPGSAITDAAVSADGTKLATIDTFLTNCVKVWDIATETQVAYVPKTNWTAYRVAFTPEGELVTTVSDRSVLRWNLETGVGQQTRSYPGITSQLAFILELWLPDATTLAAACSDGNVFRWNLATGALLGMTPGEPVLAITSVPGSTMTVGANVDYVVQAREIPSGNVVQEFFGHTASVLSAAAISPNGKYVVSGGNEASTRLWNRQTGAAVRNFVGQGAGTLVAIFTANGSNLLTTIGLPNPAAQLWDVETGALVREFKWTGSWPMGATLSPDGTRVAARAMDERIRIFDFATGNLLRTLNNTGIGRAVAFSPIAPLLIATGNDSTANLYNHETGQLLHGFFANMGPVTVAAFSRDGRTILVGWQDGLIRLFDAFNLEMKKEFFVSGFLNAVTYSPDGQFIFTGEGWPTLVAGIYDAETGEQLRVLAGHRYEVGGVGFSPDGTAVVTGAEIVREWSIVDLAARLRTEWLNGQLKLSWSVGTLQHAPEAGGPWEDVPQAVSPLMVDSTGPARFYRVQVPL